jgi:hypothetical protein
MLAIEIWGVGLGGTKGGDGKWDQCVGKAVLGLLFLWSLCVFGYISFLVEEGVCVRDCRGLGLCKFGIVGFSVGDECE